jgi:hypothetical protein
MLTVKILFWKAVNIFFELTGLDTFFKPNWIIFPSESNVVLASIFIYIVKNIKFLNLIYGV